MALGFGMLIVRLIVGLGFAAHGAQKLFGSFGGYGLDGTGAYFEKIGFRPGRTFALLAGGGELVGGLLLALGALGPVGPALMIATMVTASSVHLAKGFFGQNGGYELPLLYGSAAALFAFVGYGAYSIDAIIGIPVRESFAWGGVAVGIIGGLGSLALKKTPPAEPAKAT